MHTIEYESKQWLTFCIDYFESASAILRELVDPSVLVSRWSFDGHLPSNVEVVVGRAIEVTKTEVVVNVQDRDVRVPYHVLIIGTGIRYVIGGVAVMGIMRT